MFKFGTQIDTLGWSSTGSKITSPDHDGKDFLLGPIPEGATLYCTHPENGRGPSPCPLPEERVFYSAPTVSNP